MRRQPQCSNRQASTSWESSTSAAAPSLLIENSTMSPAATIATPSSADYGSALSQSMNYAQTWLYGTVSLKPQCRPGMYVVPEQPSFAIVMCNCPEFLIGTTRSKKSLCKKCGGARTTNWNFDEFNNKTSQVVPTMHNLNRGYNTVRINRPMTMDIDPYLIMRQSRFKNQIINDTNNQSILINNKNRRSILECHVNPYDLIKFNKYYDTGQNNNNEIKKYSSLKINNNNRKIHKLLETNNAINSDTNNDDKKITKILRKIKNLKKSNNNPINKNDLRIAGRKINIPHNSSHKMIDEDFIKDEDDESDEFNEPDIDYSDCESDYQDNQNRSKCTNKDKTFNQNINKDKDLINKNQNETMNEQRNSRTKLIQSTNLNQKNQDNIEERYQIYNGIEYNDKLKNIKINENVISNKYNTNKRHSYDAYKMKEILQSNNKIQKRHSVDESDYIIKSDMNESKNNEPLFESDIKSIPRISLRIPPVGPSRPPRKSKSVDCSYRSNEINDALDKPRAYSMDRTNSFNNINQSETKHENIQSNTNKSNNNENIITIKTHNDKILKYKRTNSTPNMSTFKDDTILKSTNTKHMNTTTTDYKDIKASEDDNDDLDNNYLLQKEFNSKKVNNIDHMSHNKNHISLHKNKKYNSNIQRKRSDTSDYNIQSNKTKNDNETKIISNETLNDSNNYSSNTSQPIDLTNANNNGVEPMNDNTNSIQNDYDDIVISKTNNSINNDSSDYIYDLLINRNNKYNSISSTNSYEIKSILKKKLDDDSSSVVYMNINNSVMSSNESTVSNNSLMTSSSIGNNSNNIEYSLNKQRKKKQVQFDSSVLIDEPVIAMIQNNNNKIISFNLEDEGDVAENGDTNEENEKLSTKDEGPNEFMEDPEKETSPNENDNNDSRKVVRLHRSKSDRTHIKLMNHNQANSFKDTMRIKNMRKHYNKDAMEKLLSRPKEPPPPPPKHNGGGNTIENVGKIANKNDQNKNSIKSINKVFLKELPSIPEEQHKLSPILVKKDINGSSSLLLKEINEKLLQMRLKKEQKIKEESNIYDDVDEEVEDTNNVDSDTITKSTDIETKSSNEENHDGDAEHYETIEIKQKEITQNIINNHSNVLKTLKEIQTKKNEQINKESSQNEDSKVESEKDKTKLLKDKTVEENIRTSLNNVEPIKNINEKITSQQKVEVLKQSRKDDDLSTTVDKIKTTSPANINDELKIKFAEQKDLSKREELECSKDDTKPSSPIKSTFIPNQTSTPITNNIKLMNSQSWSKSQGESPIRTVVSTISLAKERNESPTISNVPIVPKKGMVDLIVPTIPKKSTGTSILINNNERKSSIIITNSDQLPSNFIVNNNNNNYNSKDNLSLTKSNVTTININSETSDNTTYANVKNYTNDNDIYHTNNIQIYHNEDHNIDNTYNAIEEQMLDSLISIPDQQSYEDIKYNKNQFNITPSNNKNVFEISSNGSMNIKSKNDVLISAIVNRNAQFKEQLNKSEKYRIEKEKTNNLENENSMNNSSNSSNKPCDSVSSQSISSKSSNDDLIENINMKFQNLIKDNYDPIKAVKDKLVPHICNNNETTDGKENLDKVMTTTVSDTKNENLLQSNEQMTKPNVDQVVKIINVSKTLPSDTEISKNNETITKTNVEYVKTGKSNIETFNSNMDTIKDIIGTIKDKLKSTETEIINSHISNVTQCSNDNTEDLKNNITDNAVVKKDKIIEKETVECQNIIYNGSQYSGSGSQYSSNSGSHYYMSSRIDTIIEEIEQEHETDEDHYETIGEPIYDEIPPPLPSSSPPPLPLSPPPTLLSSLGGGGTGGSNSCSKSIFGGASKYDILNYLVDAKQRFIEPHNRTDSTELNNELLRSDNELVKSDSEYYNSDHEFDFRINSDSSDSSIITQDDSSSIYSDRTIRKEYVDIERNDSGVGSETSKCSRSKWQTFPSQHECEDCEQPVNTQVTESGIKFAPLVCEKCTKFRTERREIILEIMETEEKYGRDLQIILDEFYKPMLVAGLLTLDQLSSIFLNVEELLEHNLILSEKLRDVFDQSSDDEMMIVYIGRMFIDAIPMLRSFESYCTRQGTAALILANLEKEKELLRIFLRVSQMENNVLRRMNLNSFLMVPVQRVTKYPLLLARLYKVTPEHYAGKDLLIEAQHNIQLHLEHINSLARDLSSTKLWRKISMMNGRRVGYEAEDITNIKLRKLAVDVLDWNQEEVRFVLEERLLYTQPTEHNWRRGRTLKLTSVNAILVTLGKGSSDLNITELEDDMPNSVKPISGIKEASLVLLKEKNGRFTLLREPLYLDKCIVCCEIELENYFELQEITSRDSFIFKADEADRTKLWFKQLQILVQGLGQWRKRRNALANIMMYSVQNRA